MSNAPTCPTLFNFPHDEINKANHEFVYISDGEAGEICQLYNTLIDEGDVDEPTAKEAAMECIDRLRKVYSLEKRTRELLENVVEEIGPQSLADMPEERRRKIEGLLRKNESDDEENDPSHFCSCQKTAERGVDEPK